MTSEEAVEILLNMANDLQIFPDSKQGQAIQEAIWALNHRKYGFWKETENGNFLCSECGRCTPAKVETAHCPACGARMGVN